MKNFLYLTATITAVVAPFAVESVRSQSVFIQPFSSTGYSSTTIYVPSLPQESSYANGGVTTTTIVVPASPSIYPNSNYFPGSNTFYGGNGNRSRRYPQPTVIFTQPTPYPRVIQSSCSTSIIGSPIPSPIAINQSGIPCR